MPTTAALTQNAAISVIMEDYLFQANQKSDLLQLLPIAYQDTSKVIWDMRDNRYGLMNARGLEGTPEVVDTPGIQRFAMDPGYYGEKTVIGETQLTLQREPGTAGDPIEPETLIDNAVKHLSERCINQVKAIVSSLLRTGKFNVRSRTGAVAHADTLLGYNTLSPTTGWAADPVNATPIDDLLYWQNLLGTGTTSDFGNQSMLLCQQSVVNDLFKTTQVRSFRINTGNTVIGIEKLNEVLLGYGLPKLKVCNEGYYQTKKGARDRTASDFVRHLPAKSIIWAATRPEGQISGQFIMTRNMAAKPPAGMDYVAQDLPTPGLAQLAQGLYTFMEYFPKPPSRIELDVGFNGGPAVMYPSAFAGISYA